ncbi:hypothetical protein [Actinomadura atramentaria]|uniref:hypothetical protein n=1 Tax=Actinomadura atramentaria TaxID=1990 RepID=UPI0003A122AE|nr:hypothetical protein [Actinomadura atramentaria]
MSDQGERGPRRTENNDAGEHEGAPTGPLPSAADDAGEAPAEAPAARIEPKTEPRVLLTAERDEREPAEADAAGDAAGDDVKVAPVPPRPAPDDEPFRPAGPAEPAAWDGELFEGDSREDADSRYVAPTTDAGPGKPGRPSSGNWTLPDWMDDEEAADAKLGERTSRTEFDEPSGRSRTLLFGGIGLLVVALIAAGGVYYLKHRSDSPDPEPAQSGKGRRAAAVAETPQVDLPPDKPLRTFAGTPSKVLGRVSDPTSGLAYPRFAAPWQTPTKKNKLGVSGWSGQQIVVTEKHGAQLWYGQFLTGTLLPTLRGSYSGPDSVKTVTALAAKGLEENYYAFDHKSVPLASQALTVGGRPGWLMASYYTYKRPPFKATGEVVATAVIDTGRPAPAVVFASLPNTNKKLWPDLNRFLSLLKVLPPTG